MNVKTIQVAIPEVGTKVTCRGTLWHILAVRAYWADGTEQGESGFVPEAHLLPISDEWDDLSSPDNPDIWVDADELDGFSG